MAVHLVLLGVSCVCCANEVHCDVVVDDQYAEYAYEEVHFLFDRDGVDCHPVFCVCD